MKEIDYMRIQPSERWAMRAELICKGAPYALAPQ